MKRIIQLLLIVLLSTQVNGAPSVLRLHVLANSNSVQDQQVKLMVRDEVSQYMEESMRENGISTFEEAYIYAQEHLGELTQVAQQVLDENGMDYEAKAELGKFDFPDKSYGDTQFPAGTYHAVRIQLGEAQGENWWCVLFPPLCFIETPAEEEVEEVEYTSFFWELFH